MLRATEQAPNMRAITIPDAYYPYRLDARHAVYADFTSAPGVGASHSYFEGEVVKRNRAVRRFFRNAFTGRCAECDLTYDVASRMYRF